MENSPRGNPRRVVWLLDGLRLGGAERIAQMLAAQGAPEGWELRLLTIQDLPESAAKRHAGNPQAQLATSMAARRRVDAAGFTRLLRQLRRLRPDLIHAHLTTATLWGTAAGQLLRIPVIATLHVLPQEARGARNACLQRGEIFALNHLTRRVITLGEAQQHAWENAGLRREQIVRLPHGIRAPASPAGAREDLRSKLSLKDDDQLWLTIAVVREKKGWREWLQAAHLAMRQMPRLHFAWVGNGQGFEQLQRQAALWPSAGRLHLPGAQEVSGWLAAADGFLFPSREEAQPTALLEAMATGLPIAASDLAANREVLGEAGIYFPCGNAEAMSAAILSLARHSPPHRQGGEAAQRRYRENFQFENWRRRLFALYAAILDHPAPQTKPVPTAMARSPQILMPEFFSTGGLYHYSLQLAQALARQGAQVRLLTGKNPELMPETPMPGLTVRSRLVTWNPCQAPAAGRYRQMLRRLGHGARYYAAWAQIVSEARQWRPDWLLLGDLEHRSDAWGLRLLARSGQGLAVIWHNVQAIERNRKSRLLKDQPWRDGMCRAFQLIFVHGDWARGQLSTRLENCMQARANRLATPRIVAIPHGAASLMLSCEGPDPHLDQRLRLPQGVPLGLCFGALTRYKGIPLLLNALARLGEHERPAILIAGRALADAPLAEWQAQARAEGLETWVTWDVRYIPAQEVGWYFRRADFVCLPYQAITQSGVAHLALSWGKPMIVTQAGGLPEIVEASETGWVVPPNDPEAFACALREARTQPLRLARYGQAAQKRAEIHPSWDAIAARILAEFHTINSEGTHA